MKPEIKERWITALKSGNYKQGVRKLKSSDSFCCLGVLCDIVKYDLGLDWTEDKYDYFSFDDSYDILPKSVVEYCEIEDNPIVKVNADDIEYLDWDLDEIESYQSNQIELNLTELNDHLISFEQISRLIEKYL